MDDTNKAVIPPPPGTRFVDGELKLMPHLAEQDAAMPKDKVVGELLRSIANSISPMLQFEEDVASNYCDGRLPILDLKVWVESSVTQTAIRHNFYKKPMASKATLLAKTAFPTSQVRAIMVEEVLRRLRNCDPDASWGERGAYLTSFAASMRASGHSEHFRRTVFTKAVDRFCKELEAHKSGQADLYRSRVEQAQQVAAKGGKTTRDNWFRRVEDGGERVTSVLRVPYSRGGTLREQINESVKGLAMPKGLKTKIQEQGGSKLAFHLTKSDPFPRDSCGRSTCPITFGDRGCREQCYQAHSNYAILCSRCDPPEEVELEVARKSSRSLPTGEGDISDGAVHVNSHYTGAVDVYCADSELNREGASQHDGGVPGGAAVEPRVDLATRADGVAVQQGAGPEGVSTRQRSRRALDCANEHVRPGQNGGGEGSSVGCGSPAVVGAVRGFPLRRCTALPPARPATRAGAGDAVQERAEAEGVSRRQGLGAHRGEDGGGTRGEPERDGGVQPAGANGAAPAESGASPRRPDATQPPQAGLAASPAARVAPAGADQGTSGAVQPGAQQRRPPRQIYCGETSRGCHMRFAGHLSKYKDSKGFMWEHTEKAHNGERGEDPARDFYMKLCKVDKDPIRRVVRESIRIKNGREREDEGGTAMFNDKSEWFGVKIVSVEFKQE